MKKLVARLALFFMIPFGSLYSSGCAVFVPPLIPQWGEQFDLSPFWSWKALNTDHFQVVFPEELSDQAKRVGKYLEEAHALLSPMMKWEPGHKVMVFLLDNTDSANGLASAAARLGMVLYLTPPDSYSSIYHYSDWLKLLTIHEYTHYLNMDPTTGVNEGVRFIFGDIVRPNGLLPLWMLEGLAVYTETRFTDAGRGRSPYFEMFERLAVHENALNDTSFISLDRINGPNPYFPGGQTPYVFGYFLMNQVASDPTVNNRLTTADRGGHLRGGDDALGELSKRSAGRIPFFVNGNLDNITEKSWYQYWAEYKKTATQRQKPKLAQLKKSGVTPVKFLTEDGIRSLGCAISPDGEWIAYTRTTLDKWSSLYFKNLKTGKTIRPDEKIGGAGKSFSNDSKFLLYSSIRRHKQFRQYSDLAYLDVRSGSTRWLSKGLRARDPSLSSDGKFVTFVRSEKGTNSLYWARVGLKRGRLKLGKPQLLFQAPPYGKVANPKVSPDSRSVVFSLHKNTAPQESLMRLDLRTKVATPLFEKKGFHRFPVYGPKNNLYFVSDITGVDNLYRWRSKDQAELVTNFRSGLWLPCFGPDAAKAYGSVFTLNGFEIAQFPLKTSPVSIAAVTIERNIARPMKTVSDVEKDADTQFDLLSPKEKEDRRREDAIRKEYAKYKPKTGEITSYSAIDTLLPRQWAPLILIGTARVSLGGVMYGADALDRHRYSLGVVFDSASQSLAPSASYSFRHLGPRISFAGSYDVTSVLMDGGGNLVEFARTAQASSSISFPFRWTFSSLTPFVSFAAERSYLFDPTSFPAGRATSNLTPTVTSGMTYSYLESSSLAFTAEGGRTLTLSGRAYFADLGRPTVKGFASWREYFRLFDHVVLAPFVAGSYSTTDFGTPNSNVRLNGFGAGLGTLNLSGASYGLNGLTMRGYPGLAVITRAVAHGSVDLKFPIWRIFRGLGTTPFFFKQFYGTVFGEVTYIPRVSSLVSFNPSAGGGIHLAMQVFTWVPLTLSAEFQYGLNQNMGGAPQAVISIGARTIQF